MRTLGRTVQAHFTAAPFQSTWSHEIISFEGHEIDVHIQLSKNHTTWAIRQTTCSKRRYAQSSATDSGMALPTLFVTSFKFVPNPSRRRLVCWLSGAFRFWSHGATLRRS